MRVVSYMSNLLKTVLPDSYVTLHYRIGLRNGHDVINTFVNKPATLLLGSNQLHPPLEKVLIGMMEGQHSALILKPEQAFGLHNSELLQRVSKTLVQHPIDDENKTLVIGDWLTFNIPERGQIVGQLKAQDKDVIWLDFNHPLAGLTIVFEVYIIAVL